LRKGWTTGACATAAAKAATRNGIRARRRGAQQYSTSTSTAKRRGVLTQSGEGSCLQPPRDDSHCTKKRLCVF
jgi:hypothetical protein